MPEKEQVLGTRYTVFQTDLFDIEGLDLYEQMTYIVLRSYCGNEATAFPSIKSISKRARVSERKAQYCIQSLKDKGLIFIEAQYKANIQKSNLYTVRDASWLVMRQERGE